MSSPTNAHATWSESKVSASDGTPQAWFGSVVTLVGDMALVAAKNMRVGANASQGVVYVFRRIAGSWTQVQTLAAPNGEAGMLFGTAMAAHGGLAVITAPFANVQGVTWRGAAYVYRRIGDTWHHAQTLTSKVAVPFDTFGVAVAINATSIFIGAGGVTTGGHTIPRKVYVFLNSPGPARGWVQSQVIASPTPQDVTSGFGGAIAASDQFAMFGARASQVGASPGQGLAYVATQGADGQWSIQQTLSAPDGVARANFGVSIGIAGDIALIGAPGDVVNGNVSQGSAYRFERAGNQWLFVQKITASDGQAINLFGGSVAVAHGHAIVGAYGHAAYRGTAYVFGDKGKTYGQTRKLDASDGASPAVFGYYVAIDTTVALVGAYQATVAGHVQQGAAYFYALPPSIGPAP